MRAETYNQMVRRMRRTYPFFRLMSPVGGVVMPPVTLGSRDLSSPQFSVFSTTLGHLTMTSPSVAHLNGQAVNTLGGAGSDDRSELALLRCVAEAAERYATAVHSDDSSIFVSANELGAAALDLDTLPKCSARELADPKCPVRNPVKDRPIRWVKGACLTDGNRPVWVPKVLTHLYVTPTPDENFVFPITTGVAVHTDLATALVSAICEVVERDAIALTWLARLPLPLLDVDCDIPTQHRTKFHRMSKSLLRPFYFDATSDVGVPTVYGVQCLDAHPNVARFVSCATDFDMFDACAKIIREAAAGRLMFEDRWDAPADVMDFMALEDGASFMGRMENRHKFDFLTGASQRRSLARQLELHRERAEAGSSERLRWLIARMRQLGMDVCAVDISTDELRAVGLWAVRVVVPQLMPMSTFHRARFLGHPRLYDYPKAAGFGALSEQDVNPDPQPFA